MEEVAQARPATGWFIRGIVRRKLEAPSTHLPLDEEYWLALRHPSEVYSAGRDLLATSHSGFSALSPPQQEHVWGEFRAYVRQAEGFYRGARSLPWRSAPLNYYYAFMNLAKAMAVARGKLPPQDAHRQRRLYHGLVAEVVPGPTDNPTDKWKLTVGASGVFPLLYRESVGVPVRKGVELDARELLGYVPSISWQLGESGSPVSLSWFPCRWVFHVDSTQMWDSIGVFRRMDLSRLPAGLSATYQSLSVEAARILARETAGLQAVQAAQYRFLERAIPIPLGPSGARSPLREIEESLCGAIPNCVFEHLEGLEYQFCIGLPYVSNSGRIPMNSLAATYAVMYFLSSLVRYHPDYMDRIAESADAWLIESFTKSAPLSLLRELVSKTLGYTLIFVASRG